MSKTGLRNGLALAVAAAAAVQTGCALPLSEVLGAIDKAGIATQAAAPPEIGLADLGLKPEQTQEIQTAGILAKHSSKFTGTVSAPQGVLAKHSSKYRIQAYSEEPVSGVFVMLMSPDMRVYTSASKVAAARTDAEGKYDLSGIALPEGTDVLVYVQFQDKAHYMQSYARTAQGENVVNVDVASTFVARFVGEQTRAKGRALGSVDQSKLAAIRGKTKGMLQSGALTLVPEHLDHTRELDLMIGYYEAMASRGADLLADWTDLLGSEPVQPKRDAGPVQTETGTVERHEGI